MMKINVAQIKQAIGGRQSFRFLRSQGDLGAIEEHFWLDGKIEVLGEIINNGRVLIVEGTVKATARQNCNRCLKEFVYQVEIPFSENFRETGDCINHDDLEESLFCGDEIDISEPVRETLVLSEPLKAVCSENCLGLCPKCGVDRNISPCSCEQETIDPRLAALQQLLDKSKN